MSVSAACSQDLIDADVADTFIVSRDSKYAPLRVDRDAAEPFHYRKHFQTVFSHLL